VIIAQHVLNWQQGQPVDKIYFDPDDDPSAPPVGRCYTGTGAPEYETPAQLKAAYLAAVNAGRIFVNYYGHGGIQYWAHEALLTLNDISSMNNGSRLPVNLPMTCLVGNFVVPGANAQAIEETAFRRQGGGSVGSFAPTGLQVNTAHHYLNEGFYDAAFGQDLRRLGDLVFAGKLALDQCGAPCSNYRDLLDTYMLMGDPATVVQIIEGP
jgi:hypothetical protein